MTSPADHDRTDKSIGALLNDTVRYLIRLVRGEVALAKAEVQQSIRTAITGLILILVAVVIAISAINVLSAALVGALVEQGVSHVWAALIVAAVLCVVAVVFGWLGVNALKPANLFPTQTAENVRRDARAIKEIVDHDPTH